MARWKAELREWAEAFIFAVVIVAVLHAFVVANYMIDGDSMLPTLHHGERVLFYRLGQRLGIGPERGDIIFFEHAGGTQRDLVKRVIGVAGDVVEIRDGKVFVNGAPVVEPYLASATLGSYGPITVEEGTVFVLGDNRNLSMDSRDPSVGLIPLKRIYGRAIFVYWPLSAWRWLGR
ncbi:MAG: signal peptidase I [Bacillota bacterium]|jgi:signal peptidase I